jgi:hypothetical protein
MLVCSQNFSTFSNDKNTKVSIKETEQILCIGDNVACGMRIARESADLVVGSVDNQSPYSNPALTSLRVCNR